MAADGLTTLDPLNYGQSTGGSPGSGETTSTLGQDRKDVQTPVDQYHLWNQQISQCKNLLLSITADTKGGTRLRVREQSSNPFGVNESGFYMDTSGNAYKVHNGTPTSLTGGGGGSQGGTTSASHVPYASGANTLADGELSFNSGTHTYSLASSTVVDFSAATAAMKGPAGGVSSLAASSAVETLLATNTNTVVTSLTPGATGLYLVTAYYRIFTASTNITIKITYNDDAGSQTQTIVNQTGQAVGSYTVPAVIVSAHVAPLSIEAQAGTAAQIVISAAIVRLT